MATSYLQKQISSAGSTTTATISVWVKRNKISSGEHSLVGGIFSANDRSAVYFQSDDTLTIQHYEVSVGVSNLRTNRKFRDVNAWYHIVVNYDTSNATANNRLRLYVNGVEETSFQTRNNPSLNLPIAYFKSNTYFDINGRWGSGGANVVGSIGEQLMAHLHVIDGTAYDASTFGETDANGVWTPKTSPSVTYGTNGFFLKFENSGSMGTDSSPNGNNFTVNGTLTQTVDTPSNVYATLNSLDTARTSSGTPAFQNGNTTAYNASFDGSYLASTMAVNKGKWYAEFKIGAGTNTRSLGILDVTSSVAYIGHPTSGSATNSYAYNSTSSGGILKAGNTTIASSVGTTTDGDIVSVMIDLDSATKTIKFQKNGVDLSGTTQMTISQSSDTYWIFAMRVDGNQYVYANFGNGYFGTTAVSSAGSNGNGSIFEYDVPTGYYALNTKNLATYG
jgi:uncharacterized protein YaaQ